jgi:arginine N-succinyltransferase
VRAVKNLEEEGFTFRGKVDIFDAGPVLECPRDQIRTIRQSKVAPLIGVNDQPGESPTYIMGKTTSDFRAVKGPIDTSSPGGVKLTTECAKALKVYVGEPIRYVELKPASPPASPPPSPLQRAGTNRS